MCPKCKKYMMRRKRTKKGLARLRAVGVALFPLIYGFMV